MPKYRDLNAPPKQQLADIVMGLRDRSSGLATGATGVHHYGRDGDAVWTRPDGTSHSVRNIDGELQGAQGRIDDAEQSLAATQVRLDDAEQTVTVVQGDLDTLETVTLPNAVETLEQADQAAQQELVELDSRLTAVDAVADQATIDARDAHNEAVAAQTAVDAAIASGASMIANGSFEEGSDVGWPIGPGGMGARASIDEEPGIAHSGSKVLNLFPDTGVVHPNSTPFSVYEGQVLHVRAYYRRYGGDGTSNVRLLVQAEDAAGVVTNRWAGLAPIPASNFPFHEWILVEGDVTIEAGDVTGRVMPYASGPSLDKFYVDDMQVLDVTEARRAQARADEAYAEAASKLDEAEVDAKITASANGKNSITRSTSAASGSGAVEGDLWVQVDGSGDGFAQWYWDGSSWVPSLIKNEMMESLDVHKLQVTGSAAMDEAVIDKLWVDGLVGKTATFNSLTISSSNLIPDPGFADGGLSDSRMANSIGNGVWVAGGSVPGARRRYRFNYDVESQYLWLGAGERPAAGGDIPVEPGVTYRLSIDSQSSGDPMTWRWAMWWTMADGSTRGGAAVTSGTAGGTGGRAEWEWTCPDDVTYVTPAISVEADAGSPGSILDVGYPVMHPKTGAVLIEDGAITAPKITFTEELSGNIVDVMSTESKKLVVTGEAILNHATLIGQTVVDDINVQGKLIGTDGVFTGTVDFANVNVTDQVLADRISGEYIYGTVIEAGEFVGGSFRTSDALPGQVTLSDDAYVTHFDGGGTFPGVRVVPIDTTNMALPAGIGPSTNGLTIFGGRNTAGGSSIVQASPTASFMRTFRTDGTTGGEMMASPTSSLMQTYRTDGTIGGVVQTSPIESLIRTYSGNSSESGWVQVRPQDAELAYVDASNTYFSRIKADANEAFIYTKAGGTSRYLTVDADGVWVKTNKSGSWEAWNLELTANDSGWRTFPLNSAVTGAGNPAYRIKGGVIFFRGTLTLPGANWASGWTTLGAVPAEARPSSNILRAGASIATPGIILQILPSGTLEMWLPQSYAGSTTIQLSPMFYPIG